MQELISCFAHEEGVASVIAFSVGAGIALILLGTVFYVLLRFLVKGRPAQNWTFGFGHGDSFIRTKGGSTVILFLVFIILVFGFALWFVPRELERFSEKYSVAFDASEKIPLKSVRDRYQRVTNTNITLEGNIESFAVKGRFSNDCVAELFLSICRQYNNDLICERNLKKNYVHIGARTAGN